MVYNPSLKGAVHVIPESFPFRNEFRSRLKFALHSNDKIDWLCLALARVRFSRQIKNKDAQAVSREMLLCLLMAISAILTNNLTIRQLLWAKQERQSRFSALSSNCGIPYHLGTEFVLGIHDTRMRCHNRTRISFGLKTGMNSFRNDLCGNEISPRYRVNRSTEIYGDGTNLFWNESHSGIMKKVLR